MRTKFKTIHRDHTDPAERLVCQLLQDAIGEMRRGLCGKITRNNWRAVISACWLLDEQGGRQWVDTLPPEAADLVISQAREVVQRAVDAGFVGIKSVGVFKGRQRLLLTK